MKVTDANQVLQSAPNPFLPSFSHPDTPQHNLQFCRKDTSQLLSNTIEKELKEKQAFIDYEGYCVGRVELGTFICRKHSDSKKTSQIACVF